MPRAAANRSANSKTTSSQSSLKARPSSSVCHFLSLPAEIRITILTMLLTIPGLTALFVDYGEYQRCLGKNKWEESTGWHIAKSSKQRSVQILRVSRQIRQEGLPIFYMCNKFDISFSYCYNIPQSTYQNPVPMLKRGMGNANLKLIRHVVVSNDVKLPALVAALKGLQSITVCGVSLQDLVIGKLEEIEVNELQRRITESLPEFKTRTVLAEILGLNISLRLIIAFRVDDPRVRGIFEVEASLRKKQQLHFTLLSVDYDT